MALTVEIHKKLGSFCLNAAFAAEDEVLALLGASGCGKSMTLKCIAGIERPDSGRIVLDDRVLFDSERHIDLPPQQRRVGYLFQQYALFPNMTVRRNIAAGVRDKRRVKETVDAAIEAMRLTGLEDKLPARLSGGQQQRVALARILVNDPQVLMLDEPFSALDSHLRFSLERELREAIRRFGKTVLLVSHDRDEVYRMSDRIAVMRDGRVETCGGKDMVFAAPQTRHAAMLTGCRNIAGASACGAEAVHVPEWNLTLRTGGGAGQAVYAGIRMHDVVLCGGPGENTALCTVDEVIVNPFSVTVMLRPPGASGCIGAEIAGRGTTLCAGDTVYAALPKEKILLLKE